MEAKGVVATPASICQARCSYACKHMKKKILCLYQGPNEGLAEWNLSCFAQGVCPVEAFQRSTLAKQSTGPSLLP